MFKIGEVYLNWYKTGEFNKETRPYWIIIKSS